MSATLDDVIDAVVGGGLHERAALLVPPCTSAFVADTIAFSNVDGPGNRFVVFLQGCNFDCVACHNPQTIPGSAATVDGHRPHRVSIDELMPQIRRAAPFIRGITVSGGEATQQAAFVHTLCAAIKANPALHHLTCFVDTNGACPLAVWDDLERVIDGVMVDLKCLDPEIHRTLTGQANDRVLASIRHLHGLGRLHEVRLLLVAGINDTPSLIRATGRWLARIDPAMRVRVIGFRAHGTRPHDPPLLEPTPESLAASAAILHSVADLQVTVV